MLAAPVVPGRALEVGMEFVQDVVFRNQRPRYRRTG